MRTLVSLGWASQLTPPPNVDVHRRQSDWGLTGWRKRIFVVVSALKLLRAARQYERLVVVTPGIELFVVAALLPRAKELVAADWLVPRSRLLDNFRPLRRVRYVVVRRSDIRVLSERFSAANVEFVHFPAPQLPTDDVGDGEYVYSAGWAHRDWTTLMEALRLTGFPAVISANAELEAPPSVSVLSQLSPEDGRERMRRARCVALTFVETSLPSGPLVLLDAMAYGKAVVATDVGGSRDYVDNGKEALLVTAGDVPALATALEKLWTDDALRQRLGIAARRRAATMTEDAFWRVVLR